MGNTSLRIRGGKMIRQNFSVEGPKVKNYKFASYACRYAYHQSPINAVTASIERTTKLACCTMRYDGYNPKTRCQIYQGTFGRRCPGGGYTPIMELWVFVEACDA